jgi:hypothetical protein
MLKLLRHTKVRRRGSSRHIRLNLEKRRPFAGSDPLEFAGLHWTRKYVVASFHCSPELSKNIKISAYASIRVKAGAAVSSQIAIRCSQYRAARINIGP